MNSWTGTKDIFEVRLVNANGINDDYQDNNFMQSEFESVPVYQNTFAVWTQTNLVNETTWDFYKVDGSVYASSFPFMQTNSQYRDTITFDNGCYTFLALDSDEDGLDFWANNDGSGYIRFRNTPGTWFTDFNPDFGTEIRHQFIAGSYVSPLSLGKANRVDFRIYPNPTNGHLHLEGQLNNNTDIICYNMLGDIVYQESLLGTNTSWVIDFSSFPLGIYSIQVSNNDGTAIKKFIKK